jgi:hypothetical protein
MRFMVCSFQGYEGLIFLRSVFASDKLKMGLRVPNVKSHTDHAPSAICDYFVRNLPETTTKDWKSPSSQPESPVSMKQSGAFHRGQSLKCAASRDRWA